MQPYPQFFKAVILPACQLVLIPELSVSLGNHTSVMPMATHDPAAAEPASASVQVFRTRKISESHSSQTHQSSDCRLQTESH